MKLCAIGLPPAKTERPQPLQTIHGAPSPKKSLVASFTGHVASDVHLPHHANVVFPKYQFRNPADVLFLCGDVGPPLSESYSHFLQQQCAQHEVVLLVPGNHEYVRRPNHPCDTWERIEQRLLDLELRNDRLCLLQSRYVELSLRGSKRMVVAGATLWTDVQDNTKDNTAMAERLAQKYAFIRGRSVQPDDIRAMHRRDLRFFDEVVNRVVPSLKARDHNLQGVILQSHHCPISATTEALGRLPPHDTRNAVVPAPGFTDVVAKRARKKHSGDDANSGHDRQRRQVPPSATAGNEKSHKGYPTEPQLPSADSLYRTPLDVIHRSLFRSPVLGWCYGHTHTPFCGRVGDALLVSNPLGYPREGIVFDQTGRLIMDCADHSAPTLTYSIS